MRSAAAFLDAHRPAVLDDTLGPRVFDLLLRGHERGGDGQDGLQASRDLDALRGFIASPALVALFDLPWGRCSTSSCASAFIR